jgi:hypothetical protein
LGSTGFSGMNRLRWASKEQEDGEASSGIDG